MSDDRTANIERARKLRALADGTKGMPEGDNAQRAYDRHMAASGLTDRDLRGVDDPLEESEFRDLADKFAREATRRLAGRDDAVGNAARLARQLLWGG